MHLVQLMCNLMWMTAVENTSMHAWSPYAWHLPWLTRPTQWQKGPSPHWQWSAGRNLISLLSLPCSANGRWQVICGQSGQFIQKKDTTLWVTPCNAPRLDISQWSFTSVNVIGQQHDWFIIMHKQGSTGGAFRPGRTSLCVKWVICLMQSSIVSAFFALLPPTLHPPLLQQQLSPGFAVQNQPQPKLWRQSGHDVESCTSAAQENMNMSIFDLWEHASM